jgi:putative chitinase
MKIITPERIALLAPHVDSDVAAQIAMSLDNAMPQFGIETLLPRAHFMAQACWESTQFTRFEENLDYTHAAIIAQVWPHLATRAASLVKKPVALANAAYAWRNGNGGERTGDGWRYRGRGLFQLTGRDRYDAAAKALGVPFVGNPDLVAQPHYASLTAMNFWKQNNCGVHAALGDVAAVTRVINGPKLEGLDQRRALTEQAIKIFI